MKRLVSLAALIAILGGCAVIPVPVDGGGGPRSYGYDDGYHGHGHHGGPRWRYSGYRH